MNPEAERKKNSDYKEDAVFKQSVQLTVKKKTKLSWAIKGSIEFESFWKMGYTSKVSCKGCMRFFLLLLNTTDKLILIFFFTFTL